MCVLEEGGRDTKRRLVLKLIPWSIVKVRLHVLSLVMRVFPVCIHRLHVICGGLELNSENPIL